MGWTRALQAGLCRRLIMTDGGAYAGSLEDFPGGSGTHNVFRKGRLPHGRPVQIILVGPQFMPIVEANAGHRVHNTR